MSNFGIDSNRLDWSEYNDNRRFSPIWLDYKKYLKDTVHYKHDERFKQITLEFVQDAKNNPNRPDIQKRNRAKPTATTNRLAFPIYGGYMTYNDSPFIEMLFDLNELLAKYDLFDPRLFIDHSKYTQWWPYIEPNPMYKSSVIIEKDYLRLWHDFLRKESRFVCLEDIAVYGHQQSTSGPPFTDCNGRFYDAMDVYYGVDRDVEARNLAALRKNFTFIKKGFYPLFGKVFEDQYEVARLGGWINYKGSYVQAYLNHVLSTSVPGYRFNSIDKVLNAEKGVRYTKDYVFKSKDRTGSVLVPDGCITGKLDTTTYSADIDRIAKKQYHLAVQRAREIEAVGWVSQVPAAVGAQMMTRWVERSVNGFASTEPHVIDGYNKFLTRCTQFSGGSFCFLNGDRSNAETYVTTNFEEYQKLILPELLGIYKVQCTVVKFRENHVFVVEGLNSGCGRTTELNWYAGTHEAIYTIAKLTNNPIGIVASAYFNSVLEEQPYFELDGYIIKLFMCTDDIPLIIYSYGGKKLDMSVIEKAGDRMMSWEVSDTEMFTFGMHFSQTELKPSAQSIIAKLFYSEHPGFYVSDCYSFYAKMCLLPRDLQTDIYRLISKRFGEKTTESHYVAAKHAFYGWLKQFNIPISEAVDIYSPSGKIIFGEYIKEDELFESSRVDPMYLEDIFNSVRNIIK